MNKPVKAVRATITLGDINIDVFQIPDGSYGYSYDFIAGLIGRDKSILSNKKSPFYLPTLNKSLAGGILTSRKVSVEGISKSKLSYLLQNELMVVLKSLEKLDIIEKPGKSEIIPTRFFF